MNKKTILIFTLGAILIFIFTLTATLFLSGRSEENLEQESKQEENLEENEEEEENEDENKDENEDEKFSLNFLNEIANNSEGTDEIYITDDMTVGKNEVIKPGIYDLEVTGGSGLIQGTRKSFPYLNINWFASSSAEAEDNKEPTKIRIILFEGDKLKSTYISKVKFHVINEGQYSSNELGIGEFIVGRDILPGDYKLSTEPNLNLELSRSVWDISIYNHPNEENRHHKLTADNNDVIVTLREGEIIQITYYNKDRKSPSDDGRLIFTKQ